MVQAPRILAVQLMQLPLESTGGQDTELCAVSAELRGRAVLVDVSLEARVRGIRPGMTVTEARARLPELRVRRRDPSAEARALAIAGEMLFDLGPAVEVAPPCFLFVEIGRSLNALRASLPEEEAIADHVLARLAQAGHRVSVAVAQDPDTARTLAGERARAFFAAIPAGEPPRPRTKRLRARTQPRDSAPVRVRASKRGPRGPAPTRPPAAAPAAWVLAPEEEQGTLARLPIEALLWTDPLEDPEGALRERMLQIRSSLRVLGIHDVAGLLSLPSAQFISRFGEAGALLVQRAQRQRARPLRRFEPPERITDAQEMDAPLEDLEPVLFVLRRIFTRMEARLESRALAASSLCLRFQVEPGLERAVDAKKKRARSSRLQHELRIVFARPTRRASTMLALAREKLGQALPGAMWSVHVEVLSPESDRGAQLDLFSARASKVEEVGELVGRLLSALGEEAVFSPVLADTHRPEAAWKPAPFAIERALAEVSEVDPRERRAKLEREVQADLQRPAPASLPVVGEELLVTQLPAVAVPAVDHEEAKRAWPKPVARRMEDEALPPLPPRPLVLLPAAEPARLLLYPEDREGDSLGVLEWRGEHLAVSGLFAAERFECEWWTPDPLLREYMSTELKDGRVLWLYFEPGPPGAAHRVFVHGVFD